MTVSEILIKWLEKFDSEYGKLEKIGIEVQSSGMYSYSLVKAPVQNVKAFLSGRKIYTDHYTIQARLPNQSNADCVDNNNFGESLENWVRAKEESKEYPTAAGVQVRHIAITTPFYAGRSQHNSFVYQMTIAIEYEKED